MASQTTITATAAMNANVEPVHRVATAAQRSGKLPWRPMAECAAWGVPAESRYFTLAIGTSVVGGIG